MSNQTKPLTAEILKTLLPDAMIYRGFASSMDILEPGIYQVDGNTVDVPENMYNYGILEVLKTSSFFIQRYTPHEHPNVLTKCGIWVRTKFGSQAFSAWRQYRSV